uniref:Uncharacterized protein n=1 Tax=Oryza rufipogon TaxID=4529 RepID=A0A0E0Q3X6_ORYRU
MSPEREEMGFADLIRAPGRRRASSPSAVNPGDAPLPPPHRGRAILAQAGRRREEELGKEKEREEEQYVSKGILCPPANTRSSGDEKVGDMPGSLYAARMAANPMNSISLLAAAYGVRVRAK